jgi:UDP-N-acetylglucosamine:LPS N-acetylglucosamine transferase
MDGPRLLYMSSAIGMGHVSKDQAIASELRRAHPEVEIFWLAGQPAADVLREAGEKVLPEAERWKGASAIAERCTHNGQLNLTRYVYSSFPAWAANMRLIRSALKAHAIDLAVGNEAWEVDVPLTLGILRLDIPFVMITDFLGVDAVTSNGLERLGAYLLNVMWTQDKRIYRDGPHSAIFIGEVDDIPAKSFGRGLPDRRQHAREHYRFVGHVINFRPEELADRAALRLRLGYGDGPLVVCSVGGTSIGRDLLELCGRAFPVLRQNLPGVRMVLVCGPRLPAESVRAPEGVTVRGYVPRLYEHYACCDAAVVQCGASSTTELCSLGTPFVYFPIDGHFEQELVAGRLARYGAGRRMSLRQTTPEALACAICQELARPVEPCAMPVQGASRAAEQIWRTWEGALRHRPGPI